MHPISLHSPATQPVTRIVKFLQKHPAGRSRQVITLLTAPPPIGYNNPSQEGLGQLTGSRALTR